MNDEALCQNCGDPIAHGIFIYCGMCREMGCSPESAPVRAAGAPTRHEIENVLYCSGQGVAYINRRIEDLVGENALYDRDMAWRKPEIARNNREISCLKDIRSLLLTSAEGK